jgi:hypothetical protein
MPVTINKVMGARPVEAGVAAVAAIGRAALAPRRERVTDADVLRWQTIQWVIKFIGCMILYAIFKDASLVSLFVSP